MEVLFKEENNFLQEMGQPALLKFRRRFVSSILATDLAKHKEQMHYFKKRCETRGVQRSLNNGN